MAARRSWVVFVDDGSQLMSDREFGGKYNAPNREENGDILSVFFKELPALEFAKYIATRYPGKDVHVFKQDIGFTCQPKPVETKKWTADGHFLPISE